MLVLTRRCNQGIVIDGNIEISILAVIGDKVRIGIQAPADVRVYRKEVYPESGVPVAEADAAAERSDPSGTAGR